MEHWSPSFCVVDTLTFLDKWDFNFECFWVWLLSPKLSFLFINIKLLKISPSFFFFFDWVSFDLHISYELDFHFAHSFLAFRIVDTYNNFEVLIQESPLTWQIYRHVTNTFVFVKCPFGHSLWFLADLVWVLRNLRPDTWIPYLRAYCMTLIGSLVRHDYNELCFQLIEDCKWAKASYSMIEESRWKITWQINLKRIRFSLISFGLIFFLQVQWIKLLLDFN